MSEDGKVTPGVPVELGPDDEFYVLGDSEIAGKVPRNPTVHVYRAADGFRWRTQAPNGKIVAESGEAFTDHSYALESAKTYNPGCDVVDEVAE